ncbi:hypothetical protein D3C81_45690 [compost metagenome]
MTTCFVTQLGPICMAAADTRFSAEGSSAFPASAWDSSDLQVSVSGGNSYILPYRLRKIRKLYRGWAVTAGCFVTGDRMLAVLDREGADSAEHAVRILDRSAGRELAALEAMPDINGSEIYRSRLLGVPATSGRTGVWIADLDQSTGYNVSTASQIAINWPLTISTPEKDAAIAAFDAACSSALGIPDFVRAAAAMIGAARSAPDSSPVAQIGVTWQVGPSEFEARYFHGHVDEIAAMTSDDIVSRWEVLTP